jgi:microcystin-dependent protein
MGRKIFIAGNEVDAEDLNNLCPLGSVFLFAGTTVTTGWLLCDGSAVSRSTYANLFALIGTIYGSGDGSTTFNLPNFKGKIPVGYNSGETEFNALAKTGGEKTHVLTLNEIPSHNHTVPVFNSNVRNAGTNFSTTDVATTSTPASSSVGSDTAHNNLQPYIALKFIIKY